MIFTPLSGDASTSSTTPLAYILQIDDVRVLLDCGSPVWCPEPRRSHSEEEAEINPEEEVWEKYCQTLQKFAFRVLSNFPYADSLVRLNQGSTDNRSCTTLARRSCSYWPLCICVYSLGPSCSNLFFTSCPSNGKNGRHGRNNNPAVRTGRRQGRRRE